MKLFYALIFIIFLSGCSYTSYDFDKNKSSEESLKVVSILEDYYYDEKDVYTLFNSTTYKLISKNDYKDLDKLYIKKSDSIKSKTKKIQTIHSKIPREIFLDIFLEKFDPYTKYIDYNHSNKNYFKPEKISFSYDDKNILYMKIPYFTKETSKRLKTIIQSKTNLKEINIDIRDNPGGYLKDTISSIDLFIKSGNIIQTTSRRGIKRYKATKNTHITSVPITIQVNKNTASAAEIFAMVLKNQNRATIIGGEMYGKRTIQALFFLDEQNTKALKITTSKFSY